MCQKVRIVRTTVFFIYDQLSGALIHLSFIILILIYVLIYGCSSERASPGVALYWSLALEENFVAVITQYTVIDDNLERQTTNQTLCTCRLFLLT